MSEVQTFVKDVASRAEHTFWQAFTAGVAVEWAGSGLDVHSLTVLSAWHKILLMLAAAGGAAALSTVKTLAANATVRREATTVAVDGVEQVAAHVDVGKVLADAEAIFPTTAEPVAG